MHHLHSEAAPLKYDFWWNSYFTRPHQLVANITLNTYMEEIKTPFLSFATITDLFSLLASFLLSCAKRAYESQVVLVICCFLIWALFPCFCCPLLLILPHEFPWHLSITTLSSSLYPTIGSISFLSQFIPYRQVI